MGGGYLGKIDKLSVWEYLGKKDNFFCVGVGNEKILFLQCIHTSHAWGLKFYKIDSRIDKISVWGYLGKIDKISVWGYLGKIDKISVGWCW